MQFLAPDEHGLPGEWGVLVPHAPLRIAPAQRAAARAFARAALRQGTADGRCGVRLLQTPTDPLIQIEGLWPDRVQVIGCVDEAASAQVRRRLEAGTILGVVLAGVEARAWRAPRLIVNVLAGAD